MTQRNSSHHHFKYRVFNTFTCFGMAGLIVAQHEQQCQHDQYEEIRVQIDEHQGKKKSSFIRSPISKYVRFRNALFLFSNLRSRHEMCFGTNWSSFFTHNPAHFHIHTGHHTIGPRVGVMGRRGGRGRVAIGGKRIGSTRHTIHTPCG